MASTSDYMAGETISEGTFGRVVHGRHKTTDRHVAIKVVPKNSLKRHPEQLVNILTERRVLEDLKTCPAVVNLWACFHDKECLYMVMECATGGDLTQVIKAGRLLPGWVDSATHYGLQILEGLQALHTKRTLHADCKPDNILVTLEGRVQLADFGSAVELDKKTNGSGDRPQVRGTSEYASPEILRAKDSRELTVAVDLWSFGCVLYALLGGEAPFHAESDALAVDKILDYCKEEKTDADRDTLLFPAESTVSKQWKELILALLRPNAAERLGAGDDKVVDNTVAYPSIQASTVWKDVDLKQSPKFLPSEPSWLVESKGKEMKDGSKGWTSFLDIA